MSEAHRLASIARQSKLTPEERSRRMTIAVKARWANKTPEERTEYALKMLKAKKDKNVSTK